MTLPTMQFEDGDVMVKLGHTQEDWLILPRDTLSAASLYFKAMLRDRWGNRQLATHPVTGKKIEVGVLAMTVQEGVYMLDSKADYQETYTIESEADTAKYGLSLLASQDYDELGLKDNYRCDRDWRRPSDSAFDLRAMFALLFDLPVTIGEILAVAEWPDSGYLYNIYQRVANITCLANFYGLLGLLVPKISNILVASRRFWREIGDCESMRKLFTDLSIALRCTKLYHDCMRHDIHLALDETPWISCREAVASRIVDYSGLSHKMVNDMLQRSGSFADATILTMNQQLRNLSLIEFKADRDEIGNWGETYTTASTSLANVLNHNPFNYLKAKTFSKKEKLKLRAMKVAKGIWSEFLTQAFDHEGANQVQRYEHAGENGEQTEITTFPKVNDAVGDIITASESNDALSLFPRNAVWHHAQIFSDSDQDAEKLNDSIIVHLKWIVYEAAEIITGTLRSDYDEESYGLGYQQAVVQAGSRGYDRFGLVSVMMWMLPWAVGYVGDRDVAEAALDGEPQWKNLPVLPQFDTTPVSAEWLEVVVQADEKMMAEVTAKKQKLAEENSKESDEDNQLGGDEQ